MEMESSRRSAAAAMPRSSEPGLKKPRLASEAAGGGGGRDPRLLPPPQKPRPGEKERERDEREDPARGGSQQELVAQYKMALAELTFNSKPIITNLTIIAGENLHAAKGITAAICVNILEVPPEQKLPSLYLLDSIVKNIGRDYIRYFASRLPEVFCKAYKQVDPSVHPSMRHLFGTWGGVFLPATLKVIEKDLGFQPITNGSSGAATSRPDSQSQRAPAPHSIHVNPKYLEARQRLQQSTRGQEITIDDIGSMVTSGDSTGRSDRTTTVGSTARWTDLPNNRPRPPPRDLLNNSIHEKKELIDGRDLEFSSEISRQSNLGVGRIGERLRERDPRLHFGAGIAASETTAGRRNGFDPNKDFRASGSMEFDSQPSSVHLNSSDRSRPSSKNWKNSEEEEYMWDDINSGVTDYGGINSKRKGEWNGKDADEFSRLQRGKWNRLDTEHPETHLNKIEIFPQFGKMIDRDGKIPLVKDLEQPFPHLHAMHEYNSRIGMEGSAELPSEGDVSEPSTSSLWGLSARPSGATGLDHISSRVTSSSLPLSMPPSDTLLSKLNTLTEKPAETFGQQRKKYLQPASPSLHSPPSSSPLLQESPKFSERVHLRSNSVPQMGQNSEQLQLKLNQGAQTQFTQDSFPISTQNNVHHSRNLNPQISLLQPAQHLQNPYDSTSSSIYVQPKQHISVQQTQAQLKPSIQTGKAVLPACSGTHQIEVSETCDVNDFVVEPSQKLSPSNLLAALVTGGLNSVSSLQNLNIQPPLPSGPPVHDLTSSFLDTSTSTLIPRAHSNIPSPVRPLIDAVLPPLPQGPPPPKSLVDTTSQSTNITEPVANPLSTLLGSLVAKGLISQTAKEMPKVPDKSCDLPNSTSNPVISSSSAVVIQPISTKDSSSVGSALLGLAAKESKSLIGIEFESKIMREYHPLVINYLFDSLKQQCDVCGLRFILQEQLHSHLDYHASKKSQLAGSSCVSRRWYTNKSNWISRSIGSQEGELDSTASLPELDPIDEKCEPMVPADESQIICALCGEPFKDFYSEERDEWMYEGSMYLSMPSSQSGMESMDETEGHVPIVHAKCMSRSSSYGMEVGA